MTNCTLKNWMTTFRKLNKYKLTCKILSEMLLATTMFVRTMICFLKSNIASKMKKKIRWIIHQFSWRIQKSNEIHVLPQWIQYWWIIFFRSFILHRKNEISSLHIIFLHCNFYFSSTIHTQIHESIAEICHDNKNDFSRNENEKIHRNNKTSKINDEKKTFQKNNNDMNVLIRRTTKRRRFAIEIFFFWNVVSNDIDFHHHFFQMKMKRNLNQT